MPQANTWPNNMSTHATKQPTNQQTKHADVWSTTSMQEASEKTFNYIQNSWDPVRSQPAKRIANQASDKPAQATKQGTHETTV
jgi:hypothetical protein